MSYFGIQVGHGKVGHDVLLRISKASCPTFPMSYFGMKVGHGKLGHHGLLRKSRASCPTFPMSYFGSTKVSFLGVASVHPLSVFDGFTGSPVMTVTDGQH